MPANDTWLEQNVTPTVESYGNFGILEYEFTTVYNVKLIKLYVTCNDGQCGDLNVIEIIPGSIVGKF